MIQNTPPQRYEDWKHQTSVGDNVLVRFQVIGGTQDVIMKQDEMERLKPSQGMG